MKKSYRIVDPIPAVQIINGQPIEKKIPSGAKLQILQRIVSWPRIVQVDYDGVPLIVFFRDLWAASREPQIQ